MHRQCRASDNTHMCVYMMHYNLKGCTVSLHCLPMTCYNFQKWNSKRWTITGVSVTDRQQKIIYSSIAELFPWFGFRKCTPDIVCKTAVPYSVMWMCEFSLSLGWTLFKSLGTLFNTGDGVPGLPFIKVYQKPLLWYNKMHNYSIFGYTHM